MNTELDNKEIKSFMEGWKHRLKLAILIGIIYSILNLFGAGCPIKFLTGVSCPGCGMTRAVMAALGLQFHEAFYYHPLFFLVPFMFALYLFDYKLKPLHVKYIWALIIVIFLGLYIYRLFYNPSEVVTIDIYNGIVLKFIQNIILGG